MNSSKLKRDLNNNKNRVTKYCKLGCNFCNRTIYRMEEELAWNYAVKEFQEPIKPNQSISKQVQDQKEESGNGANQPNPIDTVPMELELDEVKLKESQVRKLKLEDFTRIRVRGDGCCLYRAALTGANLDANQHLELRNAVNE